MNDGAEPRAPNLEHEIDAVVRRIGVLRSMSGPDAVWRTIDPAWIHRVVQGETVQLGVRRPFSGVLQPLVGTRVAAFPRLTLPAVRAALGGPVGSDSEASLHAQGNARPSPASGSHTRVGDLRSPLETRTVLTAVPDPRTQDDSSSDAGRLEVAGSPTGDPDLPGRRSGGPASSTEASDRPWDGKLSLSVLRPTGANAERAVDSVSRVSEPAASTSFDEPPASEAVRDRSESDTGSTALARGDNRTRGRGSASPFTVLEPPKTTVAAASRSARPIASRQRGRRSAADSRGRNEATAPASNAVSSVPVRVRKPRSSTEPGTDRDRQRERTPLPAASEPTREPESNGTPSGRHDSTAGSDAGEEGLPALTVRRTGSGATADGSAHNRRGAQDTASRPAATTRDGPLERDAGVGRAELVTRSDTGARAESSARRRGDDAAILQGSPTERARLVDRLYRELERKFRIEDERRGR